MRSLNVQMPTPECHRHASFLMAFCSFLGESSSLSAVFSVISCLHAVLLCERWGRQIHLHLCRWRVEVERAHFCPIESICGLFSMVLCPIFYSDSCLGEHCPILLFSSWCNFHRSCRQNRLSPLSETPRAGGGSYRWGLTLIKMWLLFYLSFLLVTENTVKITYFLALLREPSEFRIHLKILTCFFPYPPLSRILGHEKQWPSVQWILYIL